MFVGKIGNKYLTRNAKLTDDISKAHIFKSENSLRTLMEVYSIDKVTMVSVNIIENNIYNLHKKEDLWLDVY